MAFGVTGPRNPPRGTRSPPLCRIFIFYYFFGQAAVREGFSRFPGWATCFWAAAGATLSRRRRGLEKGRGELGRWYPCHHCRRLPPGGTPITPPTPPSCYSGSSQRKMPPVPGSRFFTAQSTLGEGSQALAPEGRQRGGRNTTGECRGPHSERHLVTAQMLLRTAALLTAQALRGLISSPALPNPWLISTSGRRLLYSCPSPRIRPVSEAPGAPGHPEQLQRRHS